jgi:hypothetical protein
MHGKENLADAVFDSLDAMMVAYASEAVNQAVDKGERLDFSETSVALVERCLASIAESIAEPASRDEVQQHETPGGLDYQSRLWGAYLGEVVRKHYGGTWQMSQYPGSALAVPAIEVRGSHLYPTMKVFRRLTMGESENILAFYEMVAKRLGAPSTIH